MASTISENGDTGEEMSQLSESGEPKINGEINGSCDELMEVDDESPVKPIKKLISSDINCISETNSSDSQSELVKDLNSSSENKVQETKSNLENKVPEEEDGTSRNGFDDEEEEKQPPQEDIEEVKPEICKEEISLSESEKEDKSTTENESFKEDKPELDQDDSDIIMMTEEPEDPFAVDTNLEKEPEPTQDNEVDEGSGEVIDTSNNDADHVMEDNDPNDDTELVEESDPLSIDKEEQQNENSEENISAEKNTLADTVDVKDSESKCISDLKDENDDIDDDDESKKENNKLDTPEKGEEESSDTPEKGDEESSPDKSRTEEEFEKTPDKGKKKKSLMPINITPRRSSRNVNKPKIYIDEPDIKPKSEPIPKKVQEDPDIEEIVPQDPLAMDSPEKSKKTMVVNDPKRLVEITSSGNNKQSKQGKKEPTLVIIDTNSILSGRGPVPVSPASNMGNTAGSSRSQGYSVLPVALPAQGMYPQPMRTAQLKSVVMSQPNLSVTPSPPPAIPKPPVILPSLTDDMYVVEAPSFIVPYVYEKPPIKPLKGFVEQIEQAIKEIKAQLEKEKEEKLEKEKEKRLAKEKEEKLEKENEERIEKEKEDNLEKEKVENENESVEKMDEEGKEKDDEKEEAVEKSEKEGNANETKKISEVEAEKMDVDSDETQTKDEPLKKEDGDDAKKEVKEPEKASEVKSLENEKPSAKPSEEAKPEEEKKKSSSYFDNPLGKFFIQIGVNLVQEHVQTDLLRSQKRKKEREGSKCSPEVQQAMNSLIRSLEYSKETNEPFKLELKKCEYCSFKTESALVMAHHLETPHMRNYVYKCNFCPLEVRSPHDILYHMEAEHNVRGRLERAPAFHQCPSCPFEDNQKGKLSRHLLSCAKKYRPERNQEPPLDFEPPAKIPRVSRNRPTMSPGNAVYQAAMSGLKSSPGVGATSPLLPKLVPSPHPHPAGLIRGRGRPQMINRYLGDMRTTSALAAAQQKAMAAAQMRPGMLYRPSGSNAQPQVLLPASYQLAGSQLYQNAAAAAVSAASKAATVASTAKLLQQPSISITPLPRPAPTPPSNSPAQAGPPPTNKPGRPIGGSKATFVICEICDGYIKDLEQLRNHMQWIHKVKIHPKMIYNRPPLNCQKCQFRFFTDQGLERHLLGSHGLVTSSMQEAANKGKDGGRCPVCGRVYQWKLLNHVARDHNMSLKPAHLSYKCTVCTATFGMYKQFENHVYSAHSVVAKRVMDKKPASSTQPSTSSQGDMLKPLKINDEITIIPQPARAKTKPSSGNVNNRNPQKKV